MTVSAYIPAFNSRATLPAAIAGIRRQSIPVHELIVVDDGSSDDSAGIAEASGAKLIRHATNLGRGAARAAAMRAACGDLVLACDAGIGLPPNFVESALPRFTENSVAGAFGRVVGEGRTVAQRWRTRHLFRSGTRQHSGKDLLATGGSILRRDAVLGAGNFDAKLRAGEDAELGLRLEAAGFQVLFDPRLELLPLTEDSVPSVLRRYARWNGRARPTWIDYLRFINYGVKVMLREDLRERDFASALVSLACPHVLFWQSRRGSAHEHER